MPGIADDIAAGPVGPSAPNAMRFALPDGVTPSVSVNGGSYTPLGLIGFGATVLARAQTLLGSTIDSIAWTDFDTNSWYKATLTGSGSATGTTDRGGVLLLDTGATAGSQSTITTNNGGSVAALVGNMQTDRWYFRARVQFPSAVDAFASIGIWLSNGGGAANPRVFFGFAGSVSTTNWSIQLTTNVGALTSVATTGLVDTNWHTFEVYNDLTLIHFLVDGIEVANSAVANTGTNSGAPFAWSTNGATAASRQMKLDKLAYCFAGQ